MTKRRMLILATLAILATTGPRARAGILPDIRGQSFTSPYDRSMVFGAVVAGNLVESLVGTTLAIPIAHTFDVRPDPAAPGDPTRIVIETRLGFGDLFNPATLSGAIPPIYMNLAGTYDMTTGVIHASGAAAGSFLLDFGVDMPGGVLGLPFAARVVGTLLNPGLTLNGVVTSSPSAITITGTDARAPLGGPGNITYGLVGNSLRIYNPLDTTLSSPILTVPATGAYGTLFAWRATAVVPEPSSLVLLGIGFAGLIGIGRLRRAGVKTERG